jgi:hypothetical protein
LANLGVAAVAEEEEEVEVEKASVEGVAAEEEAGVEHY